jgi:o-succinylbenzoate synthase
VAGVKIASAKLLPFRLRLRKPLETAHATLHEREGLLVELAAESGHRGWGETLPLAGFGLETLEESRRSTERMARHLLGRAVDDLDASLDALAALEPGAPAARAALDAALHDLAARARHLRVAELLAGGAAPRTRLGVSALLAAETPDDAARCARSAVSDGFRTLKLKVGVHGQARDQARVAAVRDAVGGGVRIRLDANGAYDEAGALRALEGLAPSDIEFLEQPVAPGDLAALVRIRAASPIPIAADESLTGQRAAEELIAQEAADLLILKPATLGGLRPAARIAARARAAGVAVAVTTLLGSAVGLAAALQLAAALPGPLPDSGLATGALLERDLADALVVAGGALTLPASPGLGIAPEPSALRRCALGAPLELQA